MAEQISAQTAKAYRDGDALRLEEARLKYVQATLFYPFEYSKSEPLLSEAAELAQTNVWYWIDCGRARMAIGDTARALMAFEAAQALTGPDDRDRAAVLTDIGDVRVAQGDLAAALTAYEDGLEIARDLAARDPGNAGWARDVWVSLWRLARLDKENPVPLWTEVVSRMERMQAAGILLPMDVPYLGMARKNLAAAQE